MLLFAALSNEIKEYIFFGVIGFIALLAFAGMVYSSYKRSGPVAAYGMIGGFVALCIVIPILFLIPYAVGALPGMIIGVVTATIGSAVGREIGRRQKKNP